MAPGKPISAPSARATIRHRQAEHAVVRTVSVTAARTAGQVTALSPSRNGAAPACRPRRHSTVTPAARRSADGPKRRTAGPIPAGKECANAEADYTSRMVKEFERPAAMASGPAEGIGEPPSPPTRCPVRNGGRRLRETEARCVSFPARG